MGGQCYSITRQALRHPPNISGEVLSDGELLVEMDVALHATSVLQQSQLYGRVIGESLFLSLQSNRQCYNPTKWALG